MVRISKEMSEATSVNAYIYQMIRKRIITAEYKPGQMLSEKELAQSFGVSRTPVRETLIKLSHEGLVNIYPQRGTVVSLIDRDEVVQSQFIRESLEAAVVRILVGIITEEQIEALESNIHEQLACLEKNDYEQFYLLDEQLHELMAEMSGNPKVWEVVKSVKVQMDRVRMFNLPQPETLESLISQHQKVVDAIKSRDPKQAELQIRSHTKKVLLTIDEYIEQFPDYFI